MQNSPKSRLVIIIGMLITGWSAASDDSLPSLQVGSDFYTNVTVTTVTATDICFSHARGMGNAKLKNLSRELQKRFRYDPAKGAATEKAQADATTAFLRAAAVNKPISQQLPPNQEEVGAPSEDSEGDLFFSDLRARSYRGKRSPTIFVDQWLTPPPELTNKFVLVDFCSSQAGPSMATVPHLNELQRRFENRLAVIGVSHEPIEELQKAKLPSIAYSLGTDPQIRSREAFEVGALPYSVLIDPSGIVRYEGHSDYLTATALERLIKKYSP